MDGLLTLIQVIFIFRTVTAMICFNCDRLTEGQYCNTTVACAADQVCGITRYLLTNEGETIYRQQSCIDVAVCNFLHAPLVIGRRDLKKKHIDNKITLDFKCCAYLLCNHDKYKEFSQTPTRQRPTLPTTQSQVTSPALQCVDDPMMPCSDAEIRKIICSDANLTKTRCPKSCGLCRISDNVSQSVATTMITSTASSTLSSARITSTTSPNLSSHLTSVPKIPQTSDIGYNTTITLPTSHLTNISSTLPTDDASIVSNTTVIPNMTTNVQCVDDPNTPCNDSSVQRVICSDKTLATTKCPLSCGNCAETSFPTSPTVPATSKMTTIKLCADDPDFPCSDDQVKLVVCPDDELATTRCRKTCGICVSLCSQIQPQDMDSCCTKRTCKTMKLVL